MINPDLKSIPEAADTLAVSEAVVDKFIRMGLIQTVKNGDYSMLTPYAIRRLTKVIELYALSYPAEKIEKLLNQN